MYFFSSGLPFKNSKKLNKRCPPSSSGIGNKFMRPRFSEIRTINHRVLYNPFCQKSEDNSAILIGPPSSSVFLLPIKIS